MCPTSVAETMIETMISISNKKRVAGEYADAIQGLTTFIGSIEDNDVKVRSTFGPSLALMYTLRAMCQFEAGQRDNDPEKLELARRDVAKAESIFDQHSQVMAPGQCESLRSYISKVLDTDRAIREESLTAVLRAREELCTSSNVQTSASGAQAARTDPFPFLNGPSRGTQPAWGIHVLALLIGAVIWGISLSVVTAAASTTQTSAVTIVLILAPFLFSLYLGMKGWDWFSEYKMGTIGYFVKLMAFMFIGITFIGMIFICYWSGKTILRWLGQAI